MNRVSKRVSKTTSKATSTAKHTKALKNGVQSSSLRTLGTSVVDNRSFTRNSTTSMTKTRGLHTAKNRSSATVASRKQFSTISGKTQDIHGVKSQLTAVLGAQWGDEGKGKLVDVLTDKYDIVARFNGGANAGHSLVVNGKKYAFHLLPCGLLYPGKINVIGNGVVLDTKKMFEELENCWSNGIDTEGRLLVSDRAHFVFDFHKIVDGQLENAAKAQAIGTTKRGIGPTYSSKAKRDGIRVGEIADWDHFTKRHRALAESLQSMYGFEYDINEEQERFKAYREKLLPMVTDTITFLNHQYKSGKTILAEGANAALLDVDFGTYPYVTSSSTTAGGISTGLGLAPTKIDTLIGVVKAYTTRVGGGPFPTEQLNEYGEVLCKEGHEFGTTTGRPRRCGWLDIPVVKYSNFINGYTSINITKLDVLSSFDEIKIGTHYEIDGQRLLDGQMPSSLDDLAKVKVVYESVPGWKTDISKATSFEDLPVEAQSYLKRIESLIEIPISYVGVGPGREEMITMNGSTQSLKM